MTPERIAALVAWWVRLYTRGVPAPVSARRREELDADLHDHIAHERAHGAGDRRIALRVAGRMVRGMPADAAWRGRALARSSTRKDRMSTTTPLARSVRRVALGTAIVLLLPLLGMLVADGVDWGVFDFVFAAALVAGTGALLELAARRAGALVYRLAAAALGVAAIVLGEADDAPGLVGFGLLVIAGAVVLTVRTVQRSE